MRVWHMVGIAALVAGIVLRMFSVGWNSAVIHGDISIDVSAATSFRERGILQSPDDQPLAQHGPVWAMLGAAIPVLSPYASMQILSFISGILVLTFSFLLAKKILGRESAWVVTGFLSLSWLMIDYSGNGSLYSLQTALYLLWILVAYHRHDHLRAALLGALSGVTYLLNFQSIVLIPAGILLVWMEDDTPWRRKILRMGMFLASAAAVVSPWLIRNEVVFGDPLYHHAINSVYVIQKAGVAHLMAEDFTVDSRAWIEVLRSVVTRWIPFNLYYVARKLMILAPMAFIVAAFGGIDVIFSRKRFRVLLPLLIVAVFHLLISTAWPVMKFRYFVPLLPLVLLLATDQMMRLRFKNVLIGSTFALIVIFSLLTYRAIPTHTYYYDGAITQDAFHGNEELNYLRSRGLVP